jgi:hypothetical protein
MDGNGNENGDTVNKSDSKQGVDCESI